MKSALLDITKSNPLVEQASPIPVDRIPIQDWVRDSCKECKYHQKSWSCPPGVGTLVQTQKKLSSYSSAIFLRFRTSEDRTALEQAVLDMESAIRAAGFPRTMGFFTSPCTACRVCRYPEPCPRPERCRPTAESWGIDLMVASQEAGLPLEMAKAGDEFKPVTLILVE